MVMRLLAVLCSALLSAASSIRLDPPCGAARVRVTWDSEGRAPVRVLAAGNAMTGDEPAAGSAETGDWVTEGMEFQLVDGSGAVLASAAVRCATTGSIWPLQAGNEWHFRYRDRTVTGQHTVWRVARVEGEWAVLEPGPGWARRVRVDETGRIWRLLNDGTPQVFVDPAGGPAFARVSETASSSATLAGLFGREISWNAPVVGVGRDSGKFAQGVGQSRCSPT